MRLAICDDNELERRILHSLLKKYFSEASISCEFTLYDHGTTLYYDIMDGMEFDIIFLDLFMEDSFGLTIAKSLRELFYRGRIVFCTASADYALESYSVYASGYIVKPYRIKDIRHTLDWLLQEYQSGSYGLVQKSSIKFIPVNEIMYVESSNTKCILHRADGRTYLDEYSQRDVLEQCEINDCTPSYSQAWRMHKADREGLLTKDVIQFLMSEEKPNQRETVKIPTEKLREFAPDANPRQLEDFVLKACEHYRKYLIRQRGREER